MWQESTPLHECHLLPHTPQSLSQQQHGSQAALLTAALVLANELWCPAEDSCWLLRWWVQKIS